MTDAEIIRKWNLARSLYAARFAYRVTQSSCAGPRFAERLALSIVDKMEEDGVTEADIERLFPETVSFAGLGAII